MQAQDSPCPVSLVSTEETHVTQAQRDALLALQIECFGQGEVSDEELYEDFVARELARVFAYQGEEMVGCVSVYRRPVRYAGADMLLGGYGGVCVRKDPRRQGIGLALCREAHRLLEHERCDIAFLAAGPELLRLYGKLGFRWLGRFTYLNARGELKETDDGMVAPVCSRERFEQVLAGEEVLHLGPEGGYW